MEQSITPHGLPNRKRELKRLETSSSVQTLLECTDHYLVYPSMRPKTDICKYVEGAGFRVPKRYKGPQEALDSGNSFIMRSEHPQDYSGVSGLFESHVFKNGKEDSVIEEVKKKQEEILALDRVQEYCDECGLDYEQFISKASFEYQEYIEGKNLTVVRDEVVEGRYHIFINDGEMGADYSCYDSGNIIQGDIPDNIGVENVKNLINQYEEIARLPNFDSLQCPNIEFQIGNDGKFYFLQYKRGHQKKLQKWELDRDLQEGEVEAQFVRGSTKQGGEEFEVFHRPGFRYDSTSLKSNNTLTSKIPAYYLQNECVIQYDSLDSIFLQQHGFVSHICETQICLSLDKDIEEDLLSELAIKSWVESSNGKTPYIGIRMRVESDGKKAYVTILDTPETFLSRAVEGGHSGIELEKLFQKNTP